MKRFLPIFFLLPLFAAAGCEEKEELLPEIIFDDYAPFSPEGGEFSIGFSIVNAFEYGIMRCSAQADWVDDILCGDGSISFSLERNTGKSSRTAVFTVTYPECADISLEICQEAYDQSGGMKIDISVEMSGNRSVSVSYCPFDPDETYFTGCTLKSDILSYGSTDAFMRSIVAQMEEEAEASGLRPNAVIRKYVVSGDSRRTFDGLFPKTDYYAFAFSLDTDGSFGDNFTYEEFSSGSFDYPDAGFDFETVSSTQSSVRIICTPELVSVPYCISVIPTDEYESTMGSDDMLMASEIQKYQNLIDYYASFGIASTFEDFTVTGETDETYSGLLPGRSYYVYAFGLDAGGWPMTPLSKKEVRTREVEITDDCTFSLSFSDVRSQSFDVTVVPSDPDTRYYVYLADAHILDDNSPEDVAALLINMATADGVDWADTPLIRTGTRTLDTYDDLNASQLQADSEYVVFVFGVSVSGDRTTGVGCATCRTASVEMSDMEIDFEVRGIRPGSATVTFLPTSGETYFYGCVETGVMEGYASDESFISAMIDEAMMYGAFIPVSGEHTVVYGGDLLRPEKSYTVYAFGYSGGVSTRLFTDRFMTPAREFSAASVNITWSIRDGNELYRADPVANYSFMDKAAVTFHISPSGASSWYFSGFGNSMSYLEALDVEELLYMISTSGRSNYNAREVSYAVNWNTTLCGAGYGMDESGNEGRPVMVEVHVPPAGGYIQSNY